MSDSIICAIPVDPFFVPSKELQQRACDLYSSRMEGEHVRIVVADPMGLVHGIQNQGEFACPRCGAEIPWAWIYGFVDLADIPAVERPPCCRNEVPLGQIRGSTGEAFARFRLKVTNPRMWAVPPEVLAELSDLLGTEMSSVLQRV